MSGLRVLVAAVLVAALGAYLWFYEIPHAQKEAQKEKLVAASESDVTGITLTYPDRTIALVKQGADWRLTQPVDAAADDAAVKNVLTGVLGAEVQKSIDEAPADLAPFGLAPPTVTVKLTAKSGDLPPIAVGKNTQIGAKTYVRRDDEPKIYLTTATLQTSLTKQVKDLRNKELLAFQDDDVQRLEIAKGGQTTTVVRKDRDAWTIQPGDVVADPTEVRSYLSTLRTTRAMDFPDDHPADLAKYGLDAPRVVVTVATGKDGATTQQLRVGGESSGTQTKQVYVQRADQPTVYAVGEWIFRSLDKSAADLRDKTVLGFDSDRVGRVVVDRHEGAGVTLVRTAAGAWTVDGVPETKSKGTAIQRFVDDVKDLRGSAIAAEPPGDVAKFGLAAPALRITLTDKDGKPIGTVLAAKSGDGKYYVMREGGSAVFETRDYMYTRLDKQRRDFEVSDTTTTLAAGQTAPAPAEDEALPEDEEDE